MLKVLTLFSFVLILFSCKTPGTVFSKKTAHEQYADKLTSTGLNATALGKKWFEVGNKAVINAIAIQLPYQETGYFSSEFPGATALSFSAKRGERLIITLQKTPASNYLFFGDLFQQQNTNTRYLQSIDTLTNLLEFNVKENTSFVLRLQPELLQSCSYTLSIKTGPSLAFPAPSPNAKNKVISYWGAGRDNGARKHEGIDIGGSRGTPLLAVGEGVVSSVTENNLGGKVVFIRSNSSNETWYYAHLDSQIAINGQRVKTGDVIGLMGNTGNARTTSPHLHFGIYTMGGAVDPFPYVNPIKAEPAAITASRNSLGTTMRITKPTTQVLLTPGTLPGEKAGDNLPVRIVAATGNMYKVTLPGGEIRFITASNLDPLDKKLRQTKLKAAAVLTDAPQPGAPVIASLKEGNSVDVLASFGNYQYVAAENKKGWIMQPATN